MALINCPECGKQISDKAAQCIHCGAPMSSHSSTVQQTPVQQMPVQQIPVQQMPIQQMPVRQMPVQQIPVQQMPIQQIPVQQMPVQQIPVQQMPIQQIPVQQMPVRQMPVRQMPLQQPYQQPVRSASNSSGTADNFVEKIKLFGGKMKSYIVNYKTYPPATRRKILIAGGAVVVCLIVFLVFLASVFSLSKEEKYVLDVALDYKNNLNDPDSMVIHGDILYIKTEESDEYVFLIVSGNNNSGVSFDGIPVYKNRTYLGLYDKDSKDKDMRSANLILAAWNVEVLFGVDTSKKMKLFDGYADGFLISGEKIAAKSHCNYVENNSKYMELE